MVIFTGDRTQFNRYIGPFLRNTVQYHTRAYKNEVGCCENCQDNSAILDAAHKHGSSRQELIDKVLNEVAPNCSGEEILEVDLEKFTNSFKAAHDPIGEVIRVLCRPCHTNYDNGAVTE